jgi:hypothetical protein
MPTRAVIVSAALAAALAVLAAPVHACEGFACVFAGETKSAEDAKSASPPLKLNTFMQGTAKAAPGNRIKRTGKSAASAKARKRTKEANRSAVKQVDGEATSTPAIPVRVVPADELNEIDLRADAPGTERAPMAFAAEAATPPTTAESVIKIGRKTRKQSPARPVVAAGAQEQPADPASPTESWPMQVWTALQSTFSDVAAAFHRFGE